MKIIGVKKITGKIFKNSKGDLLKFVSKKNKHFKSFGEIYFNEIKNKKRKGWIKHKKYQCIFSVPFGEIDFILIDDRATSKSFGKKIKITLKRENNESMIVPPGIWFSFTTNKKKSILANVINGIHSDKEIEKSNLIKNILIK